MPSKRTPQVQPAPEPETNNKPTTVQINVSLPAELHKRLKLRCIQDDLMLRDAVAAALEAWL